MKARENIPKGEELMEELQQEVARLLFTDTDQVVPTASLNELGMSSMAKAQLKGIVQESYGVDLEEEMLFDDDTTLKRLATIIEQGPQATQASQEKEEIGRVSNDKPPQKSSPLCKACGC